MSALLEHAGHLSESINKNPSKFTNINIPFPICVRYIVYRFFHSIATDSFVHDIQKSALIHQKNLYNQRQIGEHSTLNRPNWIEPMYSSFKEHIDIVHEICNIDSMWNSWIPHEDIAKVMYKSINEILPVPHP